MVFSGTLMYLRLGTLGSLGSFSWVRVRVRYVIRYVTHFEKNGSVRVLT